MLDFMNLKKINLQKGKPCYKDAPLGSDSLMQWMHYLLRGHRPLFAFTTANSLLRQLIMGMQPFLFGKIADELTSSNEIYGMDSTWFWFTFFVIIHVLNYLIFYFYQHNMRLATLIKRQFSLLILQHYFSLPLHWHEKNAAGSNLQKLNATRIGIRELFMAFYYTILPMVGGLIAGFMTIYFAELPPFYYAVLSMFVLTFAVATVYASKPLSQAHGRLNETTEKLMGRVYEFVNHVRLVKSVSLARTLIKRAALHEKDGVAKRAQVSRKIWHFWFVNNFLGLFWMSLIIYLGMTDTLAGNMSVGAFITLTFMSKLVWDRIEDFGSVLANVIEQKEAFMRGVSILREVAENVDVTPAKKMPENWQTLSLKGVSFNYGTETKAALSNISLDIKRGEHVGIVGYSGSGKSTLIKLLMKQAQPTSGAISIDSAPLSNIKRDHYVQHISLVPQEVELFNDTLEENIVITNKATPEKLKKALKGAYVDEFINQLEHGLKTIVGERGVKLSGGQKQRLGIARALVRDGDIVIFDEATSALDSVSENYIQKSMKSSFKNKTMVVIAHRLATIAHLDRIVVMDKGRIVEQGTHKELLQKKGIYHKMWSLQSDGFLADS